MSDKAAADFMHDQMEALLASPALARVADRHSRAADEPVVVDDQVSGDDTEPNADAHALRAPTNPGLK